MRVLLLLLFLVLPLAAETPVVQADGDLLPAGRFAICAPYGTVPGPVTIRNLDSGATVADLGVCALLQATAASPEGDWLVVAVGDQLLAYRFTTATRSGQMAFPEARLLAASLDGKLLAVYSPKKITLLSPQLKPVRTWPVEAEGTALRFEGPNLLVLAGADGKAYGWDLTGKAQPAAAPPALPSPAAGPERTTVTSELFDTPERLCLNSGNPHQLWRFGAAGTVVNSTAFALGNGLSPDGKTLLIFRDNTVEALEPGASTRRWAVPLPGQLPSEAAKLQPRASWSHDSRKVAIAAQMVPPSTLILDATNGRPISSLPGVNWILSSDGKLAMGTDTEGVYRFVNVVTGDGQNMKGVPAGTLASFAPPDGVLIAMHGPDGFLLLNDGQVQARKEFKHPVQAFTPAWSPDGKRCALPALKGPSHLLDLVRRGLFELKQQATGFAFSPDGKWLVSSGGPVTGLWQVAPRECKLLKDFRWDPGSATPPQLSFSADSRRLLVNRTRDVEIRSVPDGQLLGRLQVFGEKDWLVYAPDGRYDGTEGGIAKLGLRGATLADYAPAAQVPQLRRPGLLQEILRDKPKGD